MYTLDEYQDDAALTAVYPGAGTGNMPELTYLTMGMAGEAGEVLNALKKHLRKGTEPDAAAAADLADEVGDVLWYAANLARALGLDLSEVALNNRKKLRDRQNKGRLKKMD